MSLRSFLDDYEKHPGPKRLSENVDALKQEIAMLRQQLSTANERIIELEAQVYGGGAK